MAHRTHSRTHPAPQLTTGGCKDRTRRAPLGAEQRMSRRTQIHCSSARSTPWPAKDDPQDASIFLSNPTTSFDKPRMTSTAPLGSYFFHWPRETPARSSTRNPPLAGDNSSFAHRKSRFAPPRNTIRAQTTPMGSSPPCSRCNRVVHARTAPGINISDATAMKDGRDGATRRSETLQRHTTAHDGPQENHEKPGKPQDKRDAATLGK